MSLPQPKQAAAAKLAHKKLESQTGKSVVSKQNYLAPGAAKGLVKPSLRKP